MFKTVAAVLGLWAGLAAAQAGGDLQARILYAYQIEDLNLLGELVQSLNTRIEADGADPALRYHLAHARYRMALLLAGGAPRAAEDSLVECVEQLKEALRPDPDAVEPLALQSACYERLADYRKLEAVMLRARAARRLAVARRLAPRNPRVLYLSAEEVLERAKSPPAERRNAFEQLELAAREFDRTSATDPDAPGWGHAETYLALGIQLQARGDMLGARNWIEKALLAAPDYNAAQREQALLTG